MEINVDFEGKEFLDALYDALAKSFLEETGEHPYPPDVSFQMKEVGEWLAKEFYRRTADE